MSVEDARERQGSAPPREEGRGGPGIAARFVGPFDTTARRHQGQGPFAYVDLTRMWHRVRFGGCVAAIVAGIAFAFAGLIVGGSLVAAAGVAALTDTRYRMTEPTAPMWPSFVIDAALIGIVAPVAGIGRPYLLTALAYLGTAALFFLATRAALPVLVAAGFLLWLPGTIHAPAGRPPLSDEAEMVAGILWLLLLFGLVWIATRAVAAFHAEKHADRQRLEALIADKDRFVATISHEVRNPLTAVVGLSAQLRDEPGLFSPQERDELLTLVVNQATEAAAIVEDLLVASRLDDGNVAIHPSPIDLDDEVESVVISLRGIVSVRHERNPTGAPAHADPVRVRQIVRNLVTNAHRYGGPNITVSTAPGRVSVADDGSGIPAEDLDRIFEPYGRSVAHRHDASSTGLGLTVSRELARLMRGNLVHAREGGHTVFRLVVPAGSPTAVDSRDGSPVTV